MCPPFKGEANGNGEGIYMEYTGNDIRIARDSTKKQNCIFCLLGNCNFFFLVV